jgi:hypothetical protein
MRLKLFTIFTAMTFLLVHGTAFSVVSGDPSKTPILKLPGSDYAQWKEISRHVNSNDGLVERIPFNQTPANWSELICIQFIDLSKQPDLIDCGISGVVDFIRRATVAAYPGNQVFWNVIQVNKNDIIYEWILPKPYKKIAAQHEIARGFLTQRGFHRVGFTRKNGKMTDRERATWIKLLQENTSVIPFKEAAKTEGFSLAL